MTKHKDSRGFSVVGVLLILVVIGILGFTGWFVYRSQSAATEDYSSQAKTSQPTKPEAVSSADPYADWKTYTNQEAGLTFRFPASWKDNVADVIRYNDGSFGGVSGTLKSPSGNTLTWVYYLIGGKDGPMCSPAASDVPFSSTDKCTSKQIYSVEKIASVRGSNVAARNLFEDSLYITETKYYTPGGTRDSITERTSDKPMYQICLDAGYDSYPAPKVGTDMGVSEACDWYSTGFNVTFPVKDQAGFNTADAKTAKLIMKSFGSL